MSSTRKVWCPGSGLWLGEEENPAISVSPFLPLPLLSSSPHAATPVRDCEHFGLHVVMSKGVDLYQLTSASDMGGQRIQCKIEKGLSGGQAGLINQQMSEGLLLQVVEPALFVRKEKEPTVSSPIKF